MSVSEFEKKVLTNVRETREKRISVKKKCFKENIFLFVILIAILM
jgi:hypothetical protein